MFRVSAEQAVMVYQQLEQLRLQLELTESDLREAKQRYTDAEFNLSQEKNHNSKLISELSSAKIKLEKLSAKLIAFQGELQRLRDIEDRLVSVSAERDSFSQEQQFLRERVERYKKELASEREKAGVYQREVFDFKNVVAQMHVEVEQLKKCLEAYASEINEKIKEKESLAMENSALQNNLDQQRRELIEANDEISMLREKLTAHGFTASFLQSQVDQLSLEKSSDESRFEAEKADLLSQLAALREENNVLREQQSVARSSTRIAHDSNVSRRGKDGYRATNRHLTFAQKSTSDQDYCGDFSLRKQEKR